MDSRIDDETADYHVIFDDLSTPCNGFGYEDKSRDTRQEHNLSTPCNGFSDACISYTLHQL